VWQYVFEAAKEIGAPFTVDEVIKKVHQKNSKIPDVTIRSYVKAMAPNHPFSGHWPSIRRLHGRFKYLGEGRFIVLEKVDTKEGSNQDAQVMFVSELQKFTVKELEEYNGKDGKPTYVAYQGKVYDLSQSGLWVDGDHMGSHQAGKDVTEEVDLAPHGEEVLDRKLVKLVGTLV